MEVVRIFISSPGDVGYERKAAEQVIARIGAEMASVVQLKPYFWEHEPMHAGCDFQGQIPPPAEFQIFVGILWSRLGTRLHSQHARPDGTHYQSGTEFEFETALEAYRQSARQTPRILIYRRTEVPAFPAEPRDVLEARNRQWAALNEFFQHWSRDAQDGGTFKAAFNQYEHTADFEDQLEAHLRRLVENLTGTSTQGSGEKTEGPPATWQRGSPYRGLKVFEYEHAPIFFGRTRAIDRVISQLRDRAREADPCPFVLIFGSSGSGKSSLLQAGVMPALLSGTVEGIGLWRRALLQPSQGTGNLFDGLATALLAPEAVPELATGGRTAAQVAVMLRENAGNIGLLLTGILPQIARQEHEAEKRRLAEQAEACAREGRPADAAYLRRSAAELLYPEPRLMLGVDQMEEMFTHADRFTKDEREQFIQALGSLARCGFVWVTATLRSDFFARCEELPDLVRLMAAKGQFHLLAPTGAELGQMIRLPAQAAGVTFEDDPVRGRLDDTLRDGAVHDPASLPLLEFALERLFEAGAKRRRLTHADYEKLGGDRGRGLRGVLIEVADRIWEKLPQDAQGAFPAVFRRLATLGPTENATGSRFSRRAVPLPSEKTAGNERAVVEAFLLARLLVADADDQHRQFISVTHEALLNEWPRLRQLLEREAAYLRRRARVSMAAADWEREGKPGQRLARGIDLAEAREVKLTEGAHLQPLESQYVSLSFRQNRRHVVRLLAGAAALVLVFAGLAVWTSLAAQAATRRKREVQGLLARSDFARGQELLEADGPPGGLTYLARSLETDPPGIGRAAADRLWFALTQRVWPLPLSAPMQARGAILSTSFSPDNRRIVTASNSGTAQLWDARSGQAVGQAMPHGKPVRCAVFSPDSHLLLTGCFDGRVRLWNIQEGEPVCHWQAAHEDSVNSAAFSPSGRWAATGARDGSVRLWEVDTGRQLAELHQPENVHTLAFDPADGTVLLTVSGTAVRVWQMPAGKLLLEAVHDDQVNSARFSPDGKQIITASDDGLARVWTIGRDPAVSPPLEIAHAGAVRDAFFSPRGDILATVSGAQLRIWKPDGSPLVEHPIQQAGPITATGFSPDGMRLATGGQDGRVQLWATRTGQALGEPVLEKGAVIAAEFSADGQSLLVATAEGSARVWCGALFHPNAATLEQGAAVEALTVSADGHWLAVACADGKARLWDLTKRSPIARALVHPAGVLCVAFSPDSRLLATGAADAVARLWPVGASESAPAALACGAPVCAVAFRADGKLLATANEAGVARCWRAPDWQPAGKPMVHAERVTALGFSADGRLLLTASNDHTARTWRAETGESAIGPLAGEREVTCAAFDPAGKVVATGSRDGSAQLWDAHTGKPKGAPLQHHGAVLALAFSPDGRRLVTGSEDATAVLWDTATGQPTCAALRHAFAVNAVAFSPDGSRLATAEASGAARLWSTEGGWALSEWMRHAQPIRGLAFSPDGRELFTGSADHTSHVWDIVGAADEDRGRLAALARAVSTVSLQESGRLEPRPLAPQDAMPAEIERRGRQGSRPGVLIPWFFADPARRAITPCASLTLPAYIAMDIATGTPAALDEAATLASGDPPAQAQIARARLAVAPP
jgi:WD40 repeat protein